MKFILPLLLSLLIALPGFSQIKTNPWQDFQEKSIARPDAERRIVPQKYRTLSLDLDALNNILDEAPLRFSSMAESQKMAGPTLMIPMPEESFQEFKIVEAPVMHPELAAKFPEIRSFAGWSMEDPTAYLRCGISQKGFHAMILSARHSPVFIDIYALDDTEHYISYFKKDYTSGEPFYCELDGLAQDKSLLPDKPLQAGPSGGDCKLRTYDLALACTGEYAQYHGGTVASVMAEFNLAIARVNGVYEREIAVTLVLVPNTDLLIFLNANTDPYTNNNGSTMLGQNQTTCNNIIGFANYDIGHVFSTGGGGVAYLQSVCGNYKGGGVTGRSNPTGDPFWIDYVCHEMGHQFGGDHTQNNDCNRYDPTAMEPGSGITIMGYAGVCAPNIENHSIDNFHAISLDEIYSFITSYGNTCAETTITGNNSPSVTVPSGSYTIPKSTPFVLTAVGSDPDGDVLTYAWEQMDPQPVSHPPVSTHTAGPVFRSFSPNTSPSRYFPNLDAIVNNVNPTWEVLPSVGRTLSFRCTVRDNFPGAGCTDEADVTLTVSGGAGPFLVTAPNTSSVSWAAGSMQAVTWNVANTNAAPVSCSQVEIFLSVDGGYTYPYTLSSGTANDGTEQVLVPDNIPNTTNKARVMVKGKGNIFFDISNQNFTITSPPSFALETTPQSASICKTGEAVYSISVQQVSGYDENVSLSVSGLPTGATANFSAVETTPPSLVELTIGNLQDAQAESYTLTITGISGSIEKTSLIELAIFDSLQSKVVLSTPPNGALGVDFNPTLSWQELSDATSYLVEIAENPAFDTLLESSIVSENSYTPSLVTAQEQVYYWRVSGINPCNSGSAFSVFAFQAGGEECTTYQPTNLPVTIPNNQATTVSASINISDAYTVSRVVARMKANHSWVGDLAAKLFSPDGLSVKLFDRPGVPDSDFGCQGSNLDLVFSDEAPNEANVLENMCNYNSPALIGSFKPIDPLSNYTGTNSFGTWKLDVTDSYPDDGGALTLWELELCRTTLQLDEAILLKNNILEVVQGQVATIDSSYLQADNGQGDGNFILLSLPDHGQLLLNQTVLAVGDIFTQGDIDGGLLSYQHDGGASVADKFQFDLLTSDNNWLHEATFHIVVLHDDLSISAILTQDISCFEGADGIITVLIEGGTSPFSFSLNGGEPQSANVFENLQEGTYSVVATDANGFTAEADSITLSSPPAILATVTVDGDEATITASGGSGVLQYSVESGAFQEGNVFSNLPNGTFSFYVRDENGCTETLTATIAVNTLIVSAAIAQQVSCFEGSDGIIEVIVNDGAPPYQFGINGGGFQDSNIFENLPAGTYTFTVQDGEGFSQTTLPFTLSNPDQINATAAADGYTVTISANGGTGDWQYSLDGGTFQSSNLFFPVAGGSHEVEVTDENGCSYSFTVNVDVAELSVDALASDSLLCWDSAEGVITALPNGGLGPYTYSLNGGPFQADSIFSGLPAGAYTVAIQDSGNFTAYSAIFNILAPAEIIVSQTIVGNSVTLEVVGGASPYLYSIDGGNFQPIGIFFALTQGAHNVVVLDANGCEIQDEAVITVIQPEVSASLTQGISCHDEADAIITVSAEGGVPPYQFSINGSPLQTDNVFSGLPAGDYIILVVDAADAIADILNFSISNPPVIEASASALGGAITVVAGGGVGALSYSLDGVNFQSANIFEGIENGDYTVTLQDENGCTATVNVVVNAILGASLEISQINCHDAADGQISVQAIDGGEAPYLYSINGGSFTSNSVFSNLGPGEYVIRVQDATGYTLELTAVQIAEPEAIQFDYTLEAGELTITAFGGTAPYQYSIDGGTSFQAENVFSDLAEGTYLIVVEDKNGCTVEVSLIYQPNSAKDLNRDLAFEVFPNPGDGLFILRADFPERSNLLIRVFDLTGRIVFKSEGEAAGRLEMPLDLRGLTNGAYQLYLQHGKRAGVKKLVIVR